MTPPPLQVLLILGVSVGLFSLSACGSEPSDGFGSPEEEPAAVDPADLCSDPGATRCIGLDFETCVEGAWHRVETCDAPAPYCDPQQGCGECVPEDRYCVDRDIYLCDELGTSAEIVESCGSGQECLLGRCYDACTLAEDKNSYLGCRFLAMASANLLDPAFDNDFAIVVTNPGVRDDAEVRVSRGNVDLAVETVAPGATRAIQLAMVPELQDTSASQIVSGGAFEVVSSVPIAAYQYNPLHFRLGTGEDATHS